MNLAYFRLMDGKDEKDRMETEMILAEPAAKQEVVDRSNARAMSTLGMFGIMPPKPPPKAD